MKQEIQLSHLGWRQKIKTKKEEYERKQNNLPANEKNQVPCVSLRIQYQKVQSGKEKWIVMNNVIYINRKETKEKDNAKWDLPVPLR